MLILLSCERSTTLAKTPHTAPVEFPSSPLVRRLNTLAVLLTITLIIVQTLVAISQQMTKSKGEKAGLEGAMLLTVAGIVARNVPNLLREVRALREQLDR